MNSIWGTEEYRNAVQGKKITASRTGAPLEIFSYADGVVSPKVWGKTEQDGTPTPSAPIDIVGVSGNIISTNGQTSDSVALPVTLHSLGISDDSFDFSDGEYVKSNAVLSFDGSETWTESTPGTTLTNLLTNGDFSNGKTGWIFASNSDVIGGQFVTTGGAGFCRQFVAIETGHDVIAICKYNRSAGGTAFVLSDGTGMYDGRVNATGLKTDGEWHTGTVRRTVVAGGTWLVFGSVSANTVGTVYADDFMLIDLTAAFGAGNEPTTGEIESWISKFNDSWFDSTTPKSWTGYPYAFSTEIADAASDCESMCSHFALGAAAYGTYSVSGTDFIFCSDMELIAFKAWLATQSATETPVKVAFKLAATDTSSLDSGNIDCYKNYTKIYSESVPDASITLTNIEEQYSPEFKVELTGMIGAQEIDIGATLIKSCSLDDACIAGGTVSIGDFVGKRFEVTFFDFDGDYASTIWDGAELTLTYSVKRTNGEYYSVTKGTFIVDECNEYEGVVFLASSDFRVKFDREFDGTIADTDTLYSALEDVCDDCSVVLGTASGSLPNATVAMTNGSVLNGLNCAEIISYIAQACGRVAYIGSDDKLYLDWYGAPDPALAYDNSIISSGQKVSNGSITVTGIKWTETDGTIHENGTASYVVSVENNPIKVSDFSSLLTAIAASLVGFSYTPSSSTLKIFNPALETMDIISVQNRRGDTVSVPIMKISVSGNSSQAIESVGDGAIKNASTPVSVTAAIERAKNKAIIVANNAQSTANGKNSMYTQDSEPSGGVYKVGDIWFDSNAGYKMHHWNGSEWHADQFDTDAFAAESITSANIESSAVTTGKIAAGAITAASGIIADLDASKIVVGPLASYSAGYDPTLIEVGGRNLALGTEFGEWVAFVDADITHSDITVENLITDGNFDTDTDWTDLTATVTVASNECEITASAQYGGVYQYYADFAETKGHVMFYGAYVYSASTSVLLILNDGVSQGSVAALTTGQYEYICGLFTVDASASALFSKIQDNRASGWTTVKVKYWTVVDLTAKYGAGNKPSLADFKSWLLAQPNGWFDTTAKVHGWIGARTNIVKATANASTTALFGAQQATTFRKLRLTEGQEYTLSYKVRGNVSAINYAHMMNSGYFHQELYANETISSETDWTEVSSTFTANSNTGSSTASYIMISCLGAFTTASWFEFCEVKLERGNKATDWCPSPPDLGIAGTTVIDGGNIKTGKIESHDGKTYFNLDNDEIVMDGGAKGKLKMNPTDGFQLLNSSDVVIGGLANVGGSLGSIAQKLTNSVNPNFYASIGDVVVGGVTYRGILGFLTADTEAGQTFTLGSRIVDYGGGDYEHYTELFSKYKNSKLEFIDSNGGVSFARLKVDKASGFSDIAAVDDYVVLWGYDKSNDHQEILRVDPDAITHARSTGGATATTKLPQIQTGTVASVGTAGWSSVSFPVAFPTGTTVKVIATPVTETAGVIAEKIRSESRTGFEITVGGTGISGVSFNWVAFAT